MRNARLCSICKGLLPARYVKRGRLSICARHYANSGLICGDRIILHGNVVSTATDDKKENWEKIKGV